MEYSIVIPVAERDVGNLTRTLPSWLALGSDDLVLALDKPASQKVVDTASRIAKERDASWRVRFTETERSQEWGFHQAHVRREGFANAKHDTILTGDADLLVRHNVLDVVKEVYDGNAALASCLRLPAPLSPVQLLRAYAFFFKEALMPPIFSGLYAFSKRKWEDTEDDGVKSLVDPRTRSYGIGSLGILGEDTYLFICMRRKYRCILLREIAALSLTRNVEDVPLEQFAWGCYIAGTGANPLSAYVASILFAYPYLAIGYAHQKKARVEFVDPYGPGFSLQQ